MARRKHAGVSEQRKASAQRLRDALVLLAGGRWLGAKYMAGYAVECLLKFKLMRHWRCRSLVQLEQMLQAKGKAAEVFTHDLGALLRLCGGWQRLRSHALWTQFAHHVNMWQPEWRYSPDPGNRGDAQDFLEAVQEMLPWIENNL